jgi:hypothetical protein
MIGISYRLFLFAKIKERKSSRDEEVTIKIENEMISQAGNSAIAYRRQV